MDRAALGTTRAVTAAATAATVCALLRGVIRGTGALGLADDVRDSVSFRGADSVVGAERDNASVGVSDGADFDFRLEAATFHRECDFSCEGEADLRVGDGRTSDWLALPAAVPVTEGEMDDMVIFAADLVKVSTEVEGPKLAVASESDAVDDGDLEKELAVAVRWEIESLVRVALVD